MSNEIISTQLQKFNITAAGIAEIKRKYLPLKIDGIEDKEGYKAVKEGRLFIKNTRCRIEKTRKELKEDSLKLGRAIDAEAKRITAEISPVEYYLETQEKAIDDEKERIKAEAEKARQAAIQARIDALQAVGGKVLFAEIAAMTDHQFKERLSSATTEYQIEQERIAAERAEAEKIEKERQEILAKEQARIKAEKEAVEAEKRKLEDKVAEITERETVLLEKEAEYQNDVTLEQEIEREIAQEQAEGDIEATGLVCAEFEEVIRITDYEQDKVKLIELAQACDNLPFPEHFFTAYARNIFQEGFKLIMQAEAIFVEGAKKIKNKGDKYAVRETI